MTCLWKTVRVCLAATISITLFVNAYVHPPEIPQTSVETANSSQKVNSWKLNECSVWPHLWRTEIYNYLKEDCGGGSKQGRRDRFLKREEWQAENFKEETSFHFKCPDAAWMSKVRDWCHAWTHTERCKIIENVLEKNLSYMTYLSCFSWPLPKKWSTAVDHTFKDKASGIKKK